MDTEQEIYLRGTDLAKLLIWIIFGWAMKDMDNRDFRVRENAHQHLQRWVLFSWPIFDYAKSEEQIFRTSLIRVPTVRGFKRWLVLNPGISPRQLAKFIDKQGNTWDDVLADGYILDVPFTMPYPTQTVIQNIRRENK